MLCLRSLCLPLLLLGTAASAQVTGVVTESSATLRFRPGAEPGDTGIQTFSGQHLDQSLGSETFGSGASFGSTSDVGNDFVEFRNGNGAAGSFTYMTSRTVVDINFTNDGTEAVTPTLHSTIAPAGLGLYTGPACLADLRNCGPGETFPGDFRNFQDFAPDQRDPISNMIAGASFTFRILGGTQTLYALSGSVALIQDEQSGQNQIVTDLGSAEAALANFRLISEPGSEHEVGFAWDATDLLVDFPQGLELQPGESSTLTYETSVESFSRAQCFQLLTGACLFAYSSFGDPIGRGGGVLPTLAALQLAASGDDFHALGFDSFAFALPTFRKGQLSFDLIGPAPVPEPAAWSLAILGFGALGGAARLRRKRRPPLAYARS
jgi:hypothetical protein